MSPAKGLSMRDFGDDGALTVWAEREQALQELASRTHTTREFEAVAWAYNWARRMQSKSPRPVLTLKECVDLAIVHKAHAHAPGPNVDPAQSAEEAPRGNG